MVKKGRINRKNKGGIKIWNKVRMENKKQKRNSKGNRK